MTQTTNMKHDRLTPYGEELYQQFLDNQERFTDRQVALVETIAKTMNDAALLIDELEKSLALVVEISKVAL